MRILVTGGTGTLGPHVVELLRSRGDEVRVLTRRSGIDGGVTGDLATGAGLDPACEGVDGIIHLASGGMDASRWEEVDVDGTRRLAAAAARAGVRHVLMISILGVDRIPLPYYRAKLAGEHALARAGAPHTVLRLPQFHELVDTLLGHLAKTPLVPVPRGVSVQPLAARDAARVVLETLDSGARGTVIAAGGPQELRLKDAAEQWLAARHEAGGRGGAVVQVPFPGSVVRALRDGHNLRLDSKQPGQSFGAWARERFLGLPETGAR
ncbi:SDR family oxidoreductase [Zafaria sp. Z1313]|uniref:SDR family oxidoreductase n=1 Tax=unclassified Zafaria TaxID=2828765 RepID=UPI002E76D607|nr:NAD(P)H-binding protein [Zafaria sp. J156]MEE1621479.1 NAD(P)H-binding protein [Zafaria sp. J156]